MWKLLNQSPCNIKSEVGFGVLGRNNFADFTSPKPMTKNRLMTIIDLVSLDKKMNRFCILFFQFF